MELFVSLHPSWTRPSACNVLLYKLADFFLDFLSCFDSDVSPVVNSIPEVRSRISSSRWVPSFTVTGAMRKLSAPTACNSSNRSKPGGL